MFVCVFAVFLFTFGCTLATSLDAERPDSVKGIVKRHDLDYNTCLNSFDVHQDKIIRTQDSRAMGAKYINERDVSSREECLRLCCETVECDVFVFEEKDPGSCYLFQCGTPEDFKCKFTKHRNYTSAVLSGNRHMTELESQIKLTQHEHELTKLRKPELLSSISVATLASPIESTTIVPQGSKETAQIIPTSSNTAEVQNRHCSRYQFECRSSGECIGIYNACDGIPQCSDGSDEAPELGCPVQAVSTQPPLPKSNPAPGESIIAVPSVTHKVIASITGHSLPKPSVNQPPPSALNEDSQLTMPVLSKQFKTNQWTPQMYGASMENQHTGSSNYMPSTGQQSILGLSMNQQLDLQQVQNQQIQELQQPPPQLVNQAKIYGREGEGLLYHPGGDLLQWPPYQQEQNIVGPYHSTSNGNSQIFSHKGNGLVSQSDSNSGQYEPLQNDFARYNYYENSPSYRASQQVQQNNWPMMHKPHDMNSLNNMEENNVNLQGQNIPQNIPLSGPGQDYYYEESFRTRVQPQTIPQRMASHSQPTVNMDIPREKNTIHNPEILPVIHEPVTNSHSEGVSVKKAEVHHPVHSNTTTEKPKEASHEHHHSSHRKMEQLTAELTLSESSFDSDIDQQNVSPRGAILSLTMGMCVTGIMLVLVGCRMRMVRRRLRRGSKSPYAHDADFLVNGMYL